MEQEIKKDDSLEELVNKVTYKNIVSLDNTRKLVDLEILNQCVELLERSQTVYLFGLGSSLLVARDMYLKLLRVNKPCVIAMTGMPSSCRPETSGGAIWPSLSAIPVLQRK